MERVNKKECADLLGVSKQRITQLAKSGVLVFDTDGKIDKDEAVKKFNNSKSRVKTTDNQENNDESLTYWKTQTEKFKSQITEIDLKKAKGELLEAEDVKENASSLGLKLQNALLSIPERISAVIAVESDPLKIRQILLQEIRESLNTLCEDLQKV